MESENIFDENKFSLYAEVILPLSLPKNYNYGVPEELVDRVQRGKRVEIQFGQRKIYSGVVKKIIDTAPADYRVKPVLSVLDELAVITSEQLQFWSWMAEYYCCTEGEVLAAALPAGFRLESESQITLHPAYKNDSIELNDREHAVIEALQQQPNLTVNEVNRLLHTRSSYSTIQSLLHKNAIAVKEELLARFRPKMETYVHLNPEYDSDEALKKLFDELERRASKQVAVLQAYLHASFQQKEKDKEILKSDLLEKVKGGSNALQILIEKNILQVVKKETSRLPEDENKLDPSFTLSTAQETALQEIKSEFKNESIVLLHGVTSSGKTHLYIKLIEEQLQQEKQTLYLVPEIALTTQLIQRLRRHFGNKIGVYHSRLSNNERVEIWNKILRREYEIMLGARSALFLPFTNLGLVIVDEEHDSSFKQNDPAPRYHGRDAAIFLAGLFKAKTLLGSATPSVETYFNTQQKKFGLVNLTERYSGIQMPEIIFSDVLQARKENKLHSHFTNTLIDETKTVLGKKGQVILFQNRRGYAPYLQCETCGWMAMCPNCDVHLTYHKLQNELRCHYCDYRKKNLSQCPACGNNTLRITGFGTEKIEDDLKIFFPEAIVGRLDLDAVRKKHGSQKIIRDFENGVIHILVGTQMVTKGLDFENVSLVGIMNADQLASQIDFRNSERAFQLMNQVSGRAGRKYHRGKVIVQYSRPQSLFEFVLNHDYSGFYEEELSHRRRFYYPPFCRLIQITFKHKESKPTWDAAKFFADALSNQKQIRVLGPSQPPIGRVRNQYLVQVLLKIQRSSSLLQSIKMQLKDLESKLQQQSQVRQVQVIVDVDPA